MSSHKTGASRPARSADAAARSAAPHDGAASPDLPILAQELATEMTRSLAAGKLDAMPAESLQTLLTAACRLYAAQVEAGQRYLPVREVSPTDIMVTASALLKAGNLAVFELGMWQSWTGR